MELSVWIHLCTNIRSELLGLAWRDIVTVIVNRVQNGKKGWQKLRQKSKELAKKRTTIKQVSSM